MEGRYQIAEQLFYKWRDLIESIIIDGFSRNIVQIDLTKVDKYYTGYPEIKFCYQVTFNFIEGLSGPNSPYPGVIRLLE
jgi:hypothetical protein